jgi:hypothetical protein
VEAAEPERLTREVRVAAETLRLDSATAEVLRAFDRAGVQIILLKGASIAQWLYDEREPRRSYVDCDLLIKPGHGEAAADVLAELGFVAKLNERDMPVWWREHALSWRRLVDFASVDLHRTLPGVGVDSQRLWMALSGGAVTIRVGGSPARALAIPARALHLALHAAQHGKSERRLGELERALARIDEATWRAAAELAHRLDATAAFAAGLRRAPAGRAIVERLDLCSQRPVDVALRAAGSPPPALTFERIARAPGLRARLAILRHKVVPPATFMRHWSPHARRSRFGLALAYAWRPIWLLGQAWPALRAWREARRATQRESVSG